MKSIRLMKTVLAASAATFISVCSLMPGKAAPFDDAKAPGKTAVMAGQRIGFIDSASPNLSGTRNAAALAFAQTQGSVTCLKPLSTGGWQSPDGRVWAPEEFDVIWYHQGESGSPNVGERHANDLETYVENGGSLLLSGSAGSLVNEMNIEPAAVRILGTSSDAFVSGVIVLEKHRRHPIFSGLDVLKPILLTSFGGNALADFYGTSGPAGDLLANGNANLGERPLVEYRHGKGHAIFVGWRLPDFTTDKDAYRPNLERLFSNMLKYLASSNANHAWLRVPPGESTYARIADIPFLRAKTPTAFTAPTNTAAAAVALLQEKDGPDAQPVADGLFLKEVAPQDGVFSARALALTLCRQEKPIVALLARRQAEQAAEEQEQHRLLAGLRIVKPETRFIPAPLKPLQSPEVDQSVLLGRSPFMAAGDGWGEIKPAYEPIEDGGFRMSGSLRQFNRMIVQNQNRLWTGDAPIFRMDTGTGNSCYSADRIFPLWPRRDSQAGAATPSMGTLRLGVPASDGKIRWLEEMKTVTTTFRPGYTQYQVTDPGGAWQAEILIAPARDSNGLICRAEFDHEVPLVWQFGGIWWLPTEGNANRVEIQGRQARITEPNLPNGLAMAGCDADCEGRAIATPFGQQVEFATKPRKSCHIVAAWGVTSHDETRAKQTMDRLNTPLASAWPEARERLKKSWFDCYVRPALEPERRFNDLLAKPADALKRSRQWWDNRRAEFQVRTPDAHLNALLNWERTRNEYHRKGPALYLGEVWQMYSHISTGWYGKEWGGDHQALEECLRIYGAMQDKSGFVNWVSPSLVGFSAENNTPYWVDHVWRHYTWTGDRQFVRDLWPAVRQAVTWQRKQNDPDGDGLFRDAYEYWNGDSNGKGPKAACPSVMSWAMLDRAARMAAVVGDSAAANEYRDLAELSRKQIFAELWREDAGRLGSVGSDGIWRGHPQIWEEYLAVNAGLLKPEQGRRAMRWIESHYGFEPQPGVKLLACSDWYPTRWSVQWIPTGDTCLAALAGLKSGDADLWWPYIRTVIMSAFRSDFPGINMGISNFGAGGGDREDVDSADPQPHVIIRGMFGIEPALHEGHIDICPAFPSDWKKAAILTPDISYEYRRDGSQAMFKIHTPRPLAKRVRANLTGPEMTTPAETDSDVTVTLGPLVPPPEPPKTRPIFMEKDGKPVVRPIVPLTGEERNRLVLFDLSAAFNKTIEECGDLSFIFDYEDSPRPLSTWWGNPKMTMAPAPRVLEASNGVRFLITGRAKPGFPAPPKNVMALASWKPYPVPGGAVVPMGMRCARVWPLLYSYVHPMKNYVPNGEIVLHYAEGRDVIESLIPPFNLDAGFQHFSLKGIPVPFGRINWPAGWGFIHQGMSRSHADALEIPCDPVRTLESIEFRAVCSEGVLGIAGLTVESAP